MRVHPAHGDGVGERYRYKRASEMYISHIQGVMTGGVREICLSEEALRRSELTKELPRATHHGLCAATPVRGPQITYHPIPRGKPRGY